MSARLVGDTVASKNNAGTKKARKYQNITTVENLYMSRNTVAGNSGKKNLGKTRINIIQINSIISKL